MFRWTGTSTQNQDRFLGPELSLRKEILLRDKEKKERKKEEKKKETISFLISISS